MKSHRILYNLYSSEKEACRDLEKLIKKYPKAFIEPSDTTSNWILYLAASENKKEIDEYISSLKKEKIQVFYQYK